MLNGEIQNGTYYCSLSGTAEEGGTLIASILESVAIYNNLNLIYQWQLSNDNSSFIILYNQ